MERLFFKKVKNKKREACSVKFLRSKGYTIIETMIAISLFIVIVMTGMNVLLSANVLYQKSQSMRSIMDNLNFIMEDMSRNLRIGYNYRCYDDTLLWDPSYQQTPGLNTPRSCASGGVIVFEEAHGSSSTTVDQWAYKIVSTRTVDGISVYDISKSTDGGLNWVQLNPLEVALKRESGFSVIGAPSTDTQQAFIIIKLVGTITSKNIITSFNLQTSVSQRTIDI